MEVIKGIIIVLGCIYIAGLLFISLTLTTCYHIFLEKVQLVTRNVEKKELDGAYKKWLGITSWIQPLSTITDNFAEPQVSKAANDYNKWISHFHKWLWGGVGVFCAILGLGWLIKKHF